tara:strand:- start:2343 stop:3368 length:1026 start_codon:yes stop_codon:yes gene_type:complete
MNYFLYLFFLTIFIFALNSLFRKKKFLISITGDKHQKFASSETIPLSGGIFIFLGIIYFYDINFLIFYIFSFLILILGFFSDLKYFKSAILRLITQVSIVIFFVIFTELKIQDTRIFLLDKLLENTNFNYLFVSFCILILINGSNFIDGLNTLNIGYYILICIVIYYLRLEGLTIYLDNLLFFILFILAIIFIINILNRIFLGDSGSYVLGFIFSIVLIETYNLNNNLSPYFIILLLWYPCFETLFSIIRKNIVKKSPLSPDTNHLHQLIFLYIKKKFKINLYYSNIISANIINLYNAVIFLISINYISNSQVQIFLILLNLFLYTVIYFKIYFYKLKNLL